MKILMLFSPVPTLQDVYVDTCMRSFEKLKLQQKIELSIGCSEVRGRRVYFDHKLEDIFSDK